LSRLTFETCFDLARMGLPPDGSSKLALALMKYPLLSGRGAAQAERDILGLADQAAKEGVPAARAAHLREWLELGKRERAAEAALQKLEALLAGDDSRAAQAAYDAFRKDFAETAAIAGVQARFGEMEKTLAQSVRKAGLWASYWSGDDKSKFQKMVLARPETKLFCDWGNGSPDPLVPADHFGIRFGGILRIEKEGKYSFDLNVNNRVKLWVDGKYLGASSSQGEAQTYSASLAPGDHQIRLQYEEDSGAAYMKIRWATPDEKSKREIPAGVFWHVPDLKSDYEQAPK
jgi:hypothetical protein